MSDKLKNLSLDELKSIYKDISLYRNLRKQLWNRWKELFNRMQTWENLLVVEYFSSIDADLAFEKALEVYKKVFKLSPKKEDVTFVKQDSISWGIKVYCNDSMVDISFSRIEKYMMS